MQGWPAVERDGAPRISKPPPSASRPQLPALEPARSPMEGASVAGTLALERTPSQAGSRFSSLPSSRAEIAAGLEIITVADSGANLNVTRASDLRDSSPRACNGVVAGAA